MYYFLDWNKCQDEDGYEPSLPDGVGFWLVADNLGKRHSWAIFNVRIEEDCSLAKVSNKLRNLLDSAMRFPPAFAISRALMETDSKKNIYTKEEYDKKYQDIIRNTIEECRTKKYVFAQAKRNEVGYVNSGEYYWLLKIVKNGGAMVSWVSDDYYIYENPISYFELTVLEIERLEKNA